LFQKVGLLLAASGEAGTARSASRGIQSVDEVLEALFRFEDQRWSERGGKSVLADPAIQRFHRVACYGLEAAGSLRLYVLKLEGRIIAVYYGFLYRDRACYYLGGFDSDFANLSPGKLLLAHAIEQAVREGAREFDFLRGQESYKYEWGAVDKPAYRWTAPGKAQEVTYAGTSDYH